MTLFQMQSYDSNANNTKGTTLLLHREYFPCISLEKIRGSVLYITAQIVTSSILRSSLDILKNGE
jgi:hypothetical protein